MVTMIYVQINIARFLDRDYFSASLGHYKTNVEVLLLTLAPFFHFLLLCCSYS